jgi:hypothetical protein
MLSERIYVARKLIARHLATQRHKQALEEQDREATRYERRHRVGLNIARTALQTSRDGASCVQFEHKVQSLHLADVDIGTLNHSREFIRCFVESMTFVMNRRINEHVRSIDPTTGRNRVFAFMANIVTELHRTGDAIALMIMTEEGDLQVVFEDYLLFKGHNGGALMGKFYDETIIKKLGLTPSNKIREQCTGAAFDGA